MVSLIRFCLFALVAISARTAMACDAYYSGDCATPTPQPTLNVSINAPSPLSWNENAPLQLRTSVSWSDGTRVIAPIYYTWEVNGGTRPNPNDGTFSIDSVTSSYNGGYVRVSIIDSRGNRAQSQAVVFNVIPQQSSGGGGNSGPQAGDCSITGPRGGVLISGLMTQDDCSNTCNNVIDNGHPYISCMFNGETELAPVQSCALYGPRGGVLTSFDSLLSTCTSRCSGAKAGHPRISCSWGDDEI